MDTSVTIIGLVIILIIAIPLYFVFRAQSANKAKIRQVAQQYKEYHFSITDFQNKKNLMLDPVKKGFLFIDFNQEPETSCFVDLKKTDSCRLAITTKENTDTILKIEFEFHGKDGKKQNFPSYSIEKDQLGQVCLYEDHQLSKKWQKLITECISS